MDAYRVMYLCVPWYHCSVAATDRKKEWKGIGKGYSTDIYLLYAAEGADCKNACRQSRVK